MAVIEYDTTGNGPNVSGKRLAPTMSVVELFRRFPNGGLSIDPDWTARSGPHGS